MTRTYGIADTVGKAAIGYGLLALPSSDGGRTWNGSSGPGIGGVIARYKNVLTPANAKSILFQQNSYWAPLRTAVVGGTVAVVGAKVAKHVPIIRSIRRYGVKIDRKVRLTLFKG